MFLRKKILIFLSTIVSLCLIIGSIYFYQSKSTNNLEVIFFDVGQGDSIFIETPKKFQILIDGGPDNTVIYKLGKYLPFYDRTIDLIILSHPHNDHLVGLVEVLKRYQVKKVLITSVEDHAPAYLAFWEEVKRQDIKVQIAVRGQLLDLEKDLSIEILSPFKFSESQVLEKLNNSSTVLKLKFNEINFLFTGDAEVDVEEELLSLNINLEADVFKAGHHGSDTSNTKKFLEAVNPNFFVISVRQNNKFGLPSLRVLNRVKRMGVEILRTDLLGDIRFVSDGEEIILP